MACLTRRRAGVLIDRDGVVNRNVAAGYVMTWRQFEFLAGAREALAILHEAGLPVAVVSNQAGVAKGVVARAALADITRRMAAELRAAGGEVAGVYYCTHSKEAGCGCRKPQPGLLRAAAADLGLCLEESYLVGDAASDVAAGRAVGATTVLVLTGRTSRSHLRAWPSAARPDFVCDDLLGAARLIVRRPAAHGDPQPTAGDRCNSV